METLMRKVKKELDTIAEKGLTSSNLETTNKLVDIYKDLKEICEIDERGGNGMYEARGRYRDYDNYDRRGDRNKQINENFAGNKEGKQYVERPGHECSETAEEQLSAPYVKEYSETKRADSACQYLDCGIGEFHCFEPFFWCKM